MSDDTTERMERLAEYLGDPEVLLQIPQPHRLRISELLDGQGAWDTNSAFRPGSGRFGWQVSPVSNVSERVPSTLLRWRPGGADSVSPQPDLEYGELYLVAVWAENARDPEASRWDFHVVEVESDDDPECPWYFSGNRYDWTWSEVGWYVPVKEIALPM